MMLFETIRYEVNQGVATVTLYRPEALNAFSSLMQRELAEAIKQLADDSAVRAVVLTGAGRAFCAGGDIKEMDAASGAGPLADRNKIQRMLKTVLMPAVGAGMNLALAADIVLAADNAKFSQIFVKVGLVPDTGGLYLLTRLIGLSRAKELCFTGRMITAKKACDMGLVSRVVQRDCLLAEANALATELAQGASVAIGLTKSLLNHAPTATLEEMADYEAYALAVVLSTHDHREGILAFQEKRTPRFSGK